MNERSKRSGNCLCVCVYEARMLNCCRRSAHSRSFYPASVVEADGYSCGAQVNVSSSRTVQVRFTVNCWRQQSEAHLCLWGRTIELCGTDKRGCQAFVMQLVRFSSSWYLVFSWDLWARREDYKISPGLSFFDRFLHYSIRRIFESRCWPGWRVRSSRWCWELWLTARSPFCCHERAVRNANEHESEAKNSNNENNIDSRLRATDMMGKSKYYGTN